ncbi:MAG: ORF6N domain-containing protein, partial [Chitinophagales bacterium]
HYMYKVQDLIVPDEMVIQKILLIRGQKVMLDSDLAELYGVNTKRLNEQVKRNTRRFPPDFMFQITFDEKAEVVAKCDHLRKLKFSSARPNAFTEHGAVMAAGILNSDRAIEVNIQIVRIFNRLRGLLLENKDILLRLEKIENKIINYDKDIQSLFQHLRLLLKVPAQQREPIGFKPQKKNQ